MATRRSAFTAGVKGIAPILVGVIPFAVITGVVAIETGMTPGLAIAMSLIVYAGASQLAAMQLIGVGASSLVIIFTAIIINLRFFMYSASLAQFLPKIPFRWKFQTPYILTDQAYAVAVSRYQSQPGEQLTEEYRLWYFLGAAVVMWFCWQAGTMLGILLGTQVPPELGLDFAIPLTFIALLIPALRNRASLAAALVAGVVVLLAGGLPYNLSLMVAALGGIGAGLLAEHLLPLLHHTQDRSKEDDLVTTRERNQ
jgi:4-azaleucine resistance transporter AzlC